MPLSSRNIPWTQESHSKHQLGKTKMGRVKKVSKKEQTKILDKSNADLEKELVRLVNNTSRAREDLTRCISRLSEHKCNLHSPAHTKILKPENLSDLEGDDFIQHVKTQLHDYLAIHGRTENTEVLMNTSPAADALLQVTTDALFEELCSSEIDQSHGAPDIEMCESVCNVPELDNDSEKLRLFEREPEFINSLGLKWKCPASFEPETASLSTPSAIQTDARRDNSYNPRPPLPQILDQHDLRIKLKHPFSSCELLTTKDQFFQNSLGKLENKTALEFTLHPKIGYNEQQHGVFQHACDTNCSETGSQLNVKQDTKGITNMNSPKIGLSKLCEIEDSSQYDHAEEDLPYFIHLGQLKEDLLKEQMYQKYIRRTPSPDSDLQPSLFTNDTANQLIMSDENLQVMTVQHDYDDNHNNFAGDLSVSTIEKEDLGFCTPSFEDLMAF